MTDTAIESPCAALSDQYLELPELTANANLALDVARMKEIDDIASEQCRAETFDKRVRSFVRLLRLADKLQGRGPYLLDGPIKETRFDLKGWGRMANDWTTISVKVFLAQLFASNECGTTACACGWAATDPYFQALGLSFADRDSLPPQVLTPGYMSFAGVDAVQSWGLIEQVFEIHDYRALFFFDANNYHDDEGTPHLVANRIRAFLASDYFTDIHDHLKAGGELPPS